MKRQVKGFGQFINESSDFEDDSQEVKYELGLIGPTQEQRLFLDEITYDENTWRFNPRTGLVDIAGSVRANYYNLVDFKGIRFGTVSGYFDCADNQLTSLEGAPQVVGQSFYCNNNKLTSLDYAPQQVGGHFYCNTNGLTSLEGAPERVGGGFYCGENRLTSLQGAPERVDGNFECDHNELTSLDGAPQRVGGNFDCRYNSLENIEESELPIVIVGKLYK